MAFLIDLFYPLEKKPSEVKEKELNGTIDEHDETSNALIISTDDHDNSGVVKEEITPKRNAERTAKDKVTKYGDGEDNDEDDDEIIHGMDIDDDDKESFYMGSDSDSGKKIKKTNTKPKQPRKPKSGELNRLRKIRIDSSKFFFIATTTNGTPPAKKKVSRHETRAHIQWIKFDCFFFIGIGEEEWDNG